MGMCAGRLFGGAVGKLCRGVVWGAVGGGAVCMGAVISFMSCAFWGFVYQFVYQSMPKFFVPI